MASVNHKSPPEATPRTHTHTMERGTWGPHTAKIVCITCGGAFVRWASTKRSDKMIDQTLHQ